MLNKKDALRHIVVGVVSLLFVIGGVVSLIVLGGRAPYAVLPIVAIILGVSLGVMFVVSFVRKKPLGGVALRALVVLNIIAFVASIVDASVYHLRKIGDRLDIKDKASAVLVIDTFEDDHVRLEGQGKIEFLESLSEIKYTWDPFFDLKVTTSYRINITAGEKSYSISGFCINDGKEVVYFADAHESMTRLVDSYIK